MIAQPADSEYQRVPADDGAHWGVDFWIGDTDAAAANAEELGGGVIVAPHDDPAFRAAVLADPNGARFGVNQLTAVP